MAEVQQVTKFDNVLENETQFESVLEIEIAFDTTLESKESNVGEFEWQENFAEAPDDVRLEFTLPDVWMLGYIAVYVNGQRQKNGVDVDVETKRDQKIVIFIGEAPNEDTDMWATYNKTM